MPLIHSAEEMQLTVFFWAFDDSNSTIGASVGGAPSSSMTNEDASLISNLNLTGNATGTANELASDQWRVIFLNKQFACENVQRGFKTQFGLWEGKCASSYSYSILFALPRSNSPNTSTCI